MTPNDAQACLSPFPSFPLSPSRPPPASPPANTESCPPLTRPNSSCGRVLWNFPARSASPLFIWHDTGSSSVARLSRRAASFLRRYASLGLDPGCSLFGWSIGVFERVCWSPGVYGFDECGGTYYSTAVWGTAFFFGGVGGNTWHAQRRSIDVYVIPPPKGALHVASA